MAYQIDLSEAAELDADAAYLWLSEKSPEFAQRWFKELLNAIAGLDFMPYRYPASPEHGQNVRRMLFGRGGSQYHVLYLVVEPTAEDGDDGIIRILHIHHAARDTNP